MTLRSILATLTLVAAPTLCLLRSSEAQPIQGAAQADLTVEACKQKCVDQYKKNVNACKKAAKTCDFWILWMCAASHLDQEVFETCKAAAGEVLDACLEACEVTPTA